MRPAAPASTSRAIPQPLPSISHQPISQSDRRRYCVRSYCEVGCVDATPASCEGYGLGEGSHSTCEADGKTADCACVRRPARPAFAAPC